MSGPDCEGCGHHCAYCVCGLPIYTAEEYEVGTWVLYREDKPIAWFETEADAVRAAELFNQAQLKD